MVDVDDEGVAPRREVLDGEAPVRADEAEVSVVGAVVQHHPDEGVGRRSAVVAEDPPLHGGAGREAHVVEGALLARAQRDHLGIGLGRAVVPNRSGSAAETDLVRTWRHEDLVLASGAEP